MQCMHFLNAENFCTLEKLKRQKKKALLTNTNWVAKLPVHHTVESDLHKSKWPVCDRKSEHIYVKVTKYGNAIHSVLLLRDVLKQVLYLWKGKANLLTGNAFSWKFKETHCFVLFCFLVIQSITITLHYLYLEKYPFGGILCGFFIVHTMLKFFLSGKPLNSLFVSFKGVSNWLQEMQSLKQIWVPDKAVPENNSVAVILK